VETGSLQAICTIIDFEIYSIANIVRAYAFSQTAEGFYGFNWDIRFV
jgi:hypothetical protein